MEVYGVYITKRFGGESTSLQTNEIHGDVGAADLGFTLGNIVDWQGRIESKAPAQTLRRERKDNQFCC